MAGTDPPVWDSEPIEVGPCSSSCHCAVLCICRCGLWQASTHMLARCGRPWLQVLTLGSCLRHVRWPDGSFRAIAILVARSGIGRHVTLQPGCGIINLTGRQLTIYIAGAHLKMYPVGHVWSIEAAAIGNTHNIAGGAGAGVSSAAADSGRLLDVPAKVWRHIAITPCQFNPGASLIENVFACRELCRLRSDTEALDACRVRQSRLCGCSSTKRSTIMSGYGWAAVTAGASLSVCMLLPQRCGCNQFSSLNSRQSECTMSQS